MIFSLRAGAVTVRRDFCHRFHAAFYVFARGEGNINFGKIFAFVRQKSARAAVFIKRADDFGIAAFENFFHFARGAFVFAALHDFYNHAVFVHGAVQIFGGNKNIARLFRRFGGGIVFVCRVWREERESFFVARQHARIQNGAGQGVYAVFIFYSARGAKAGKQGEKRFAVVRRHAGMAAQRFRGGGFRRG